MKHCQRNLGGIFRYFLMEDWTSKEWEWVHELLTHVFVLWFWCINFFTAFYLFIFLVTKICDAVAVAKILNATLVIPHLEVNPVWQDSRYFMSKIYNLSWFLFSNPRRHVCEIWAWFCSSFTDIFDVDHFINFLRDEVSIVKELPKEYYWSTREYYATGIRATRIKMAPLHASADWYLENVLPVLQR